MSYVTGLLQRPSSLAWMPKKRRVIVSTERYCIRDVRRTRTRERPKVRRQKYILPSVTRPSIHPLHHHPTVASLGQHSCSPPVSHPCPLPTSLPLHCNRQAVSRTPPTPNAFRLWHHIFTAFPPSHRADTDRHHPDLATRHLTSARHVTISIIDGRRSRLR